MRSRLRGDDVAGMAVHIGARVAHLAGAAEVLVSSTVKDLVAGSGIEFDDRGEHELKGVPGTWRLFFRTPRTPPPQGPPPGPGARPWEEGGAPFQRAGASAGVEV